MFSFVKANPELEVTKDLDYPEDAKRIQSVLIARGFITSKLDIQAAYREYSRQEWSAGWLILDENIPDLVGKGYLVHTKEPSF